MSSLFLSHTSSDKPFARRVAADLIVAGIVVWLDEAEIGPGDSLIRKIEEGLTSVEYVAAFLSPNSVKSPWVTKELDIAMTREIRGRRVVVLPLLIHDIKDSEIPAFLSDKLYVDFRNSEQYHLAFQKLLLRLKPEARGKASRFFRPRLASEVLDNPHWIEVTRRLGLGDHNERERAAQELYQCRSEALTVLLAERSVLDSDPVVRHWANLGLGAIGSSEALEVLHMNVKDPDPFAALGAQDALREAGAEG